MNTTCDLFLQQVVKLEKYTPGSPTNTHIVYHQVHVHVQSLYMFLTGTLMQDTIDKTYSGLEELLALAASHPRVPFGCLSVLVHLLYGWTN